MLVPVKWLKDYVDINNIAIKELDEKLVMSGSKTETVTKASKEIEGVVIGKILEIKGHPDADKLIITKVDIGNEILQIVTGATNLNEGDIIPVALAGAKLPGGLKIKKGKLRGEISNGMLCSPEELGFSENVVPKESKQGIFILRGEYTLGMDALEALDLDDYIIEFEITPNRPDCLSMIGMARETAATFNSKLKYPDIVIKEEVDDIKDYTSIEVQDEDLCPRYAARLVKDIKIQPSPMWMQIKLMKAGVRPINNIVDITNYVMLEYGEPLHAFDLDQLEEKRIVVRRAKENEMIKTLDDVERKLTEDVLVIADGRKPMAIAGIMGGEDSEVSKNTKTILIEAACFDKTSIRSSSRSIGLRTEASSRFEKGIDPNVVTFALDRTCQLIEKLGAGKVVKGTLDSFNNQRDKRTIMIRPERINKLIGINISTNEITDILERLELSVEKKGDKLEVTIPTFRQDLEQEIDIVEEVARIYGFDVIEATLPEGTTWGARTNAQEIEHFTRNALHGLGLNEITTYSFVSPKVFDSANIKEDSYLRNSLKLINPLGEEYSVMRTTLIPNMLEVLARNYKRNVQKARAFELGKIFMPREIPLENLPVEKKVLTLGMYDKEADFFTLKGIICNLLDRLGIKEYKFEPEKNHSTFHPGRCATIVYENHILGTIGEVHPDVLEKYGIDERAYMADVDFNIILQITRMDRLYRPLPKYPAITRDIALIIKEEVYAREIEDIINKNGKPLLEESKLFDIYKGKQIPEGCKSMAYSLTFRANDKTLTDPEVNKVYDKILKDLKETLNAELR